VVVNDLNSENVDSVVGEISRSGGVAVGIVTSCAEAKGAAEVIDTTISNFGRIDVVVGNAGTAGHAPFSEITRSEFDRVVKPSLNGCWEISGAAWPHMREQGYGRLILTASISGLYGDTGSPHYAAAKMGVYGLALSLAGEGIEHGIKVNVLCPSAATPLMEAVIPEGELKDWVRANLTPKRVAALVAWLGHESCPATGEVYGASGDVLLHYAVGCRSIVQRGFEAEDVGALYEDLRALESGAVFHRSLDEHLRYAFEQQTGGTAGESFRMPTTERAPNDPARASL
jgi:NAD(P)-dependent dehydrogenase (short-subunit alcohol dehydrogenase family)